VISRSFKQSRLCLHVVCLSIVYMTSEYIYIQLFVRVWIALPHVKSSQSLYQISKRA